MKIFFLFSFLSILTFSQTKLYIDFDQEKDYTKQFETSKWFLAKNISAYDVGSGSFVTSDWEYSTLITKPFPQAGLYDTLSFDYCVQSNYQTKGPHIVVSFRRNGTWVFEPILYITDTITDANEMTTFPNTRIWKHAKVKLLRTSDQIKFLAEGKGPRIFIDNIQVGSNTINDVAIIKNNSESGHTYKQSNLGFQIKNIGLLEKDVSVKLSFNELNQSFSQSFKLAGEEVKNVYYDCSFLPIGKHKYNFEIISPDDDTTNNILNNEVGVFNAEWKEGKLIEQSFFKAASIGLTFNDTNYLFINSGFFEDDTTFIRYNVDDYSTVMLQKPPKKLYGHIFIYKDGYIYIPGGVYDKLYIPSSQDEVKNHESEWFPFLLRYSIQDNKWDTLYNELPTLHYNPVLIRDSLLYMIGNDPNSPQGNYIFNLNTKTIQNATKIRDHSKKVIAFNDTLYVFLVNEKTVLQGIIDPIDPSIISWSNYDTINIGYSNIEKWSDNRIIFTTSTFWSSRDDFFYDMEKEVFIYDVKEKKLSSFLPKSNRSQSFLLTSFLNKDKNVLLSAGTGYPLILTEYLSSTVSVKDVDKEMPNDFSLNQNYPNPFNAQTTISYSLDENSFIKLEIFNILGERVLSLVNQVQSKGTHKVNIDLNNYASGIYIFRLQKNMEKSISKSMVMIK